MSRYFFHIKHGHFSIDKVGTELATLDDLHEEAVRSAAEFIRDLGPSIWNGEPWQMTVKDEGNSTMCTLRFSVHDRPGEKKG